MYLLDRSTYRRVGQRERCSHVSILRHLHRELDGIAFENPFSPSGIVIMDGKGLSIGGEQYCEYLIWDTEAGLIARELHPGKESPAVYDRMLWLLQIRGVAVDTATTDGLHGLRGVLAKHEILPQRCHVHLLRDLRVGLQLRKYTNTAGNRAKRILYRYCQHFLRQTDPEAFEECLRHLERHLSHNILCINSILFQAFRRFMRSSKFAFQHLSDERIPTTTNALENYISRVEARLKTMKGFKNPENAHRILIAIHLSLLGEEQ